MTLKNETITCPNCEHEFDNPFHLDITKKVKNVRSEYEGKVQALLEKLSKLQNDSKVAETKGRKLGYDEAQKSSASIIDELMTEKVTRDAEFIKLSNSLRKEKLSRKEIEADVQSTLEIQFKEKLINEKNKLREELKSDDDAEIVNLNLKLNASTEENKNLKNKINDLQRGAQQISQEVRGEAGENYAAKLIERAFPQDETEDIKKGKRGADLLQTVHSNKSIIGKILIEAKNTDGHFQKAWVDKLQQDMSETKADIGVIVSYQLPDNSFAETSKGIFICSYSDLEIILSVLRTRLISEFRLKKIGENKNEKAARVYNFLNSETFIRHVRSLVELHKKRRTQLELEKAYMQKIWVKRQAHLDNEVTVMMQFAGVLEAEGEPGDFKFLENQMGLIEPDEDPEMELTNQ